VNEIIDIDELFSSYRYLKTLRSWDAYSNEVTFIGLEREIRLDRFFSFFFLFDKASITIAYVDYSLFFFSSL